MAFFAFLLLFSLNFSEIQKYTQYLIHTVHAADLAAIVASSGADINLTPGSYTFTGDLTIPAGKTLRYERGAVITIGAGQTLNIAGGMNDPLYQIFDDKNTDLDKGVKFSAGNILGVRPEWWGARPDASILSDETPYVANANVLNSNAIEKAINSHVDHVTKVQFSSGTYWIARTIVLRGHISLLGMGVSGIYFNYYPMTAMVTDSAPIDGKQGGEIKGLWFATGTSKTGPSSDIIHFSNGTSGWDIENNSFSDYGALPGWDIYLDGISNVTIKNNGMNATRSGGIYMKGSNIDVRTNDIAHNNPSDSAIHINQCASCVFHGNIVFSSTGNQTQNVITVENSPTASIIGNKTDISHVGLRILGSGGHIEGNAFGAFDYGIYATNLNNTTIVNNYAAIDSSVSAAPGAGYDIFLENGSLDNTVIKNNRLVDAAKSFKFSGITGTYPDIENNLGADIQTDYPILDTVDTPAVTASDHWQTKNNSATTISGFSGASSGKRIFVLFQDNNTSVKFSGTTALRGNSGADWHPSLGDHMICKNDGSIWNCSCFDNTL